MNPLLDTVEPDSWLEFHNRANPELQVGFDEPECVKSFDSDIAWKQALYSRPKVEALLAECRKQTLLEAVAMVANKITYGPPLGTDMAATIHDELRRMAEGEK